jgi:hypothetical protein
MAFSLPECRALLARTPAVLRTLLSGLPEEWIRSAEGPGTWCAFDVVGHLIHSDRTNWIPRVQAILGRTDAPFPAFERAAMLEANRGRSLDALLAEFERVRGESQERLQALGLGEAELDRTGRHPEFGRVTLRQLLSSWTVHDLDHLYQISRVLAKRLGDEAGPWKAYLRILRDA